jgi:tetratricopeptide (TPR) repeat protein
MHAFHAQLGNNVRTQDALRVASSFFSDGMEKFQAGELELALALFEQALAVNQKYLQPEASGNVLCFQNIAAVHDKLGNMDEAVSYYERAKLSLSSTVVPKDERGMTARRKRKELLRQVQQKLEAIPRTHEPKARARTQKCSFPFSLAGRAAAVPLGTVRRWARACGCPRCRRSWSSCGTRRRRTCARGGSTRP